MECPGSAQPRLPVGVPGDSATLQPQSCGMDACGVGLVPSCGSPRGVGGNTPPRLQLLITKVIRIEVRHPAVGPVSRFYEPEEPQHRTVRRPCRCQTRKDTLARGVLRIRSRPGQQLRYALRNTWPGDRSIKQRGKTELVPSRHLEWVYAVEDWTSACRLQLPSDFAVRVFSGMHINVHVAADEGLGLFFCQNSRTLHRTLQRGECDHYVRVLPLAWQGRGDGLP